MVLLILGLVVFLGIHTVPMVPAMRNGIVARTGQGVWMGIFSVVSLIGLVLIGQGYSAVWATENWQIWDPPVWMSHVAALLMLPASIAIVAAYVPSRVRNVLKHPMLVAVKLWALAHLLANGDVASMILFGAFLAWAVADRISVKRRAALGPLGTADGGLTGDIIAIAGGVALYLAFLFWLHQWLIGVAPIAGMSS